MPAGRSDTLDDGASKPSGATRRTERLMCLVFILKARGRRGVTRAELLYAIEDYASCPNAVAFERMLERDKADLRDIGILIGTHQRDAWHEDQHAYVLEEGTLLTIPHLEADELRMLQLAADAWDQGTWSAMARGALRKLEVFADDFAGQEPARLVVHADAHVEPLRSAVRQRRVVAFDYRKPGHADVERRVVEPWGLIFRDGGWYCVAFDTHRHEARVFRTSRMLSQPVDAGPASQEIDPNWSKLPRSLTAETMTATVFVAPGHGWRWRESAAALGTQSVGEELYDILQLEIVDSPATIAALAAAAPFVIVNEPADLRDRVLRHLGAHRG